MAFAPLSEFLQLREDVKTVVKSVAQLRDDLRAEIHATKHDIGQTTTQQLEARQKFEDGVQLSMTQLKMGVDEVVGSAQTKFVETQGDINQTKMDLQAIYEKAANGW